MKLKVTVHGVAYEVDVEVLDAGDDMIPASPLPQLAPNAMHYSPARGPIGTAPAPAAPNAAPSATATNGEVISPIAGIVVELKCSVGASVSAGEALLIVEAMKMNTPIAAPRAGTVKKISVAKGDNVREGQSLVELE